MKNTSSTEHSPHELRWLVLALMGIGTFMTTLDVSIVNVALPELGRSLGVQVGTSQWFVLAYTFTITVTLLLFGKLGDLYGRRRLYQCGVGVFVIGSALCGLSISAIMLIVSRAVQGLGSAIIMSSGPAVVTEAFPAKERGRSLGLIGTAVALGLFAGPVIGGLILQHASWHWMFLINIPIGLALVTVIGAKVHGFDSRRDGEVDTPGAVLMALALAAIVLVLTFGGEFGWKSAASICLGAAGVALLAAFLIVESRVAHPILNLRIFRNPTFSIGSATGWGNYAAVMPISVFMPYYLAGVLGYAPAKMGLTLAFGPLTLALTAPLAGAMSDRIGPRALTTIGQALLAAGLVHMRSLGPNSSWGDVVKMLVITSFGSSLFVSPNSSAIMGSVERRDLGVASGIVALIRNLGMVSGVAIAGAIMTSFAAGFTLAGFRAVLATSAVISILGAAVSVLRVSTKK